METQYYEHRCACGCGGQLEIKPYHKYYIKEYGPIRYISGHNPTPRKAKPIYPKICKYGCGQEGKYQNGDGTWKCSLYWQQCPKGKEKLKESIKYGKKPDLTGSKNPCWRGGTSSYYHNEARKMFSIMKCVICGMTEEEHLKLTNKRLSMHCRSGDYTILEEWNWVDVCDWHHRLLDKFDGREIIGRGKDLKKRKKYKPRKGK